MKVEKFLVLSAIVLLIAAPIWSVFIAPKLAHMQCDDTDYVMYFGNATWTNPNEAPLAVAFREIATKHVISETGNTMTLGLTTTAEDLISKENFWESVDEIIITKITHEYVNGEGRFNFPINLEKKDVEHIKYYSYLPASTFKFEREDLVDGLLVYVYGFDVQGTDVTGNYPAWASSGKQILSHDFGTMWVEPKSGHVVNEVANWDIGFADGSGKVDVGGMWYTEDTMKGEVFEAQNEKRSLLLYDVLVPLLFVIIALAFLAAVFDIQPPKRKKGRKG
jgi:hypothetical protein